MAFCVKNKRQRMTSSTENEQFMNGTKLKRGKTKET